MTSGRARGLLGSIIGARFALDAVIGEGASSTVFAAHDVNTQRRVAVKVLYDPSDARIRRETRAAKISHPNVCAVTGVHSSGELTWIVMERLVGETLADRIAREGSLSTADLVDLFSQLASALGGVHEAGLVHGDVKPANVFLVTRQGCAPLVKLLDFGSSLAPSEADAFDGWHGTTAYMAPEQASRDPKIDARADIYSVGMMLSEIVCGKRPSRTFRYLLNQRDDALPDLGPDVSPAMADVIRRATARDPSQRFATARELQAALFAKPRASEDPSASGMRRRFSDREIVPQRPPKTKR